MIITTDLILKIIPILISGLALFISFMSYRNSSKATKISEKNYLDVLKEKAPDLKIIQNLWTSNPRFELINDSTSKLDETPSPSYLMFIPSKIYYHFDNQDTMSNLILTPVSYDVVIEQIVGNQTKDSIVTTYLPSNFFGKKGSRDVIFKKLKSSKDTPFELSIATYPFMVIISNVDYIYKKEVKNKIIISTPIVNKELSHEQYESIIEYMSDTANYLETKINGSESIYNTINRKIETLANKIFNNSLTKKDDNLLRIIGGKDGGYGNILKEINSLITPFDSIEQHQIIKNNK